LLDHALSDFVVEERASRKLDNPHAGTRIPMRDMEKLQARQIAVRAAVSMNIPNVPGAIVRWRSYQRLCVQHDH
jgi:hypothetical protein